MEPPVSRVECKPGSINAQQVLFLFSSLRIRDSRALSRTFMRHGPFKDLYGLSHDAISLLQRIPVTWLRCYRDTRLRDDA
jgi:hypothetical protein